MAGKRKESDDGSVTVDGKRGQNEGSIYFDEKRQRYRGAVTIPGTEQRKYFSGKTRNEVSRRIAKTLHELDQGMTPTDDRMTVQDYLERWLEQTAKPAVKYSTFASYEQNVKLYILPSLGHVRLSKLSPGDVEGMMNALIARGLSPRTVQYAHAVLRVALKTALRRNQVHRNVCTLVDPPTVSREPVKPFSVEEAKAFMLAARGDAFGTLYITTLALGLRRGEALGLRWGDVDLDAGRLHVRNALQRQKGEGLVLVSPKSRASRRAIPLPAFMVGVLKEHRLNAAIYHDPTPETFVFSDENGGPLSPDFLSTAFPKFLKAHGLRRIRYHDLRHGCASLLFAQGCTPRLVMEILGHSQISLTMNTYTHLLPEADRAAADAMQGLFGDG